MGNTGIGIKLGSISIDSICIGDSTQLDGGALTLGKQDVIDYLGSHEGPISGLELSDLVLKLKWGI